MRHFLRQFGPALEWPWTHLTDVPELTDELVETIAAQSDAQAGGPVGARARTAHATASSFALLQGLRVGGDRRRCDARRLGARPARWGDAPRRGGFPPEWVDYNGHVHESRYLQLFADATDALLAELGVDAAYLASGGSYFTVETHLSHLRQLEAGDRVHVTTQVLDSDEKRLHVFHVLLRDGEADPARDGRADAAARRHRERAGGAVARAGRAHGRRADPAARGAAATRASRPLGRRPVTRDLTPLFEPQTLAIVGVSADPGKWGYWFARDAAARRTPPARVPRRPQRRRGTRDARVPLARRAARGAGARRPQRPRRRARASGRRLARGRARALWSRSRQGSQRSGRRVRRASGARRARACRRRGARRAELPRRLRRLRPSSSSRRRRCRPGRSASCRRAATCCSRSALLLEDVRPRLLACRLDRESGGLDATELVAGARRARRRLG